MKSFCISASGLKNIVFSSYGNDNFRFLIGKDEIQIQRFFADFISPYVSHIHQSDPTIESISLNNLIRYEKQEDIKNIITSDLIENLKHISSGYNIEIDKEMCYKLQIISILLGNEELYFEMRKLFPPKSDKKDNLDSILEVLEFLNLDSIQFPIFNDTFFEDIYGHFDSIDKNKLLNLPKSVLYSIISSQNLKISSTDSLFDFINKFFSNRKDDRDDSIDKLNLISFYELLDIQKLSQKKFQEFIDAIVLEDMTFELWSKLKECFKSNFLSEQTENSKVEVKIEYDNNPNNRFKGIITHLGKGNPKSVVESGIVNVSGSSFIGEGYQASNAIDYKGKSSTQYYTQNLPDQWLCFDFKERKVKPSHYSVRSHASRSSWYNVQSWCVEGSNNGSTWVTLDTHSGDRSLDGNDASNTFEIPNNSNSSDFYRYLRFRQTGSNTCGNNTLILTALEYFGIIREQ